MARPCPWFPIAIHTISNGIGVLKFVQKNIRNFLNSCDIKDMQTITVNIRVGTVNVWPVPPYSFIWDCVAY